MIVLGNVSHAITADRSTDMFGASFRESAQLIAVADSELSPSMWRPVAENAEVEIQFYDDERCWMRGVIMKVRIQLDGMLRIIKSTSLLSG